MSAKAICNLCPRECRLDDGKLGVCRGRRNVEGRIVCDNYGELTSIALDPIEKKPLSRFHPGSMILSVGSYGCNLTCPFCQNSSISMIGPRQAQTTYVSPEALVEAAANTMGKGNIGIAFTYNEPFISYEYIRDTALIAREEGLAIVLVTNGTVNEEPLTELLPLIDAMNIDLKGFSQEFYDRVDGDFETVKRTIELASRECHVEVTTLVIPGWNDAPDEMEQMSSWLASVDRSIPYHISRFFPCYHLTDVAPTPVRTINALVSIAEKHLDYVYRGNC